MIRHPVRLALALCVIGLAPAMSWAADESAPVATADSGAGGYSLDDQIADWHAAGEAPPIADPSGGVLSLEPDRRPHGMVSVGVGSNGYRSVYGETSLPVGKTGTLDMAVGDEQGRIWGRTVHARSLSLGLTFDGAARPDCPPGPGPKDAPWRRYDAVELQRLQDACAAAQP